MAYLEIYSLPHPLAVKMRGIALAVLASVLLHTNMQVHINSSHLPFSIEWVFVSLISQRARGGWALA